MGYDANAALSYGIELPDELPWRDSEDFDTWWAEQNGLKEPLVRAPEDYQSKAYNDFCEGKEKLMNKCPVELGLYGSDSYPEHILIVRGSAINGDWSSPTTVKEKALNISPGQVTAFRAFCSKYQIDCQDLRWLLTAHYG